VKSYDNLPVPAIINLINVVVIYITYHTSQ
jgi:hypothetical protein